MEKIIKILKNNPKVDEFKIVKVDTSSTELFFIKEKLQMNRGKDVSHINLTVYKNFEADGTKFKGSSTTKLSSSDTEEEIKAKIDKAALAASFVKNAYYELPVPTKDKAKEIPSAFKEGDPVESIGKLVSDLYSQDNQFGSFVNSCEFFIDKRHARILNSKGIDIEYDTYRGEIELIVEANGEKESIELFSDLHFSDYDSEWIKQTVTNQLKYASLRAKAQPMPVVQKVPVIIRTEGAPEFWNYYGFAASARAKYEHLHQYNLGDSIQGADVEGDKVTVAMKAVLPNSVMSRYYDGDGVFLKDTVIIEDGVLKKYVAPSRFAQYMDIEVTGEIGNISVNPGGKTEAELKKGPYLEVISFSAFQMDPITGNFGGEFRLGIYFDGEKEIPVMQGTVSANMNTAQKQMYFSKELIRTEHYLVPEVIKFTDITIAGS